MNLFLCDDQPEFMAEFEKQLNEYFISRNLFFQLFSYSNGTQLLDSKIYPDIIFLDIKMEGLSGLETAKNIRKNNSRSKIIFLTSYKQYVFQSFDVDASHYLIKPVNPKKLHTVLDHVIGQLTASSTQFLTFQSGQVTIRLPYSEIMFLEVQNRKIIVHARTETANFYGKLEILEKNLPPQFFRCHRSFIANMDFILRFNKTDLFFTNGETIPVSKRKYPDFSLAFMKFIQKEGLS